MLHFFRLIRLPNLFIIALTMWAVRIGIFETLWRQAVMAMLDHGFLVSGLNLHMPSGDFALLVLSVVLIAAAGNIINDYFDTKTDRLNKPDRVVVGRTIKRRVAMALHLSMNALGLAIGLYLSHKAGSWKLAGIFVFSVVILWFYSTNLKKQMLSGNILISVLAALVPITVGMFEFASKATYDLNILNLQVPGFGSLLLKKAAFFLLGYSVFAFLSNMIREMIKDMEDIEGDLSIGAKTLPIVVGESRTRYIVTSFIIFTMILLGLVQQISWLNLELTMFWYLLLAVQLPLVFLLWRMWTAWEKKHYSQASLLCKLIIVNGVLSMFVYHYTT